MGATCANVLITTGIADEVVLIDIKQGLSEGKVMDIMQTANILGVKTRAVGVTNDYTQTEGSDVVVITSGIPRKPGMTREELIGVNAGIVKSVTDQVLAHSPNAVIVCVSNPMDTMTYLIHKTSGLPKTVSSAWAVLLTAPVSSISSASLSEPTPQKWKASLLAATVTPP